MSSDFTLKAASRPTVTITTTDDAGSTTEHPFEVLPLTKPRYDAYIAYAKKARKVMEKLEAIDEPTAAQAAEAEKTMTDAIDHRLRSTNGPCTIESLWRDGLLALDDLRALGEYLYTEASRPPA